MAGMPPAAMQDLVQESMSTLGTDSLLDDDGGSALNMVQAEEEFVSDKENLDPEGVGAKKVPTSVMAKWGYDKFDPICVEIQAAKKKYDMLRQDLCTVVKDNYGDNRTSKSAGLIEEATKAALEQYEVFQELVEKKKKDDSLKEHFDGGVAFYLTVISASGLPKMDKFGAVDAYCTFEYVRVKEAHESPEQDGHRTKCMECELKNDFGRSSCQVHRSNVASKSFQPEFNKKFKIKLDETKNTLLIGIYSWNRSGPHPIIGYLKIPVWAVLYTSETEREYPLLSFAGVQMKAVTQDKQGNPVDSHAKVRIRWRYAYKKRSSKTEFAAPGTPASSLNGWHIRRWVGGSGYAGNWVEGLPHGHGVFYGGNGSVFEGNWFKAKMQGKGKLTFPNGDVYQGMWKDGKRHGKGTCTGAAGDVYKGDWRWGFQHGKGKHVSSEGDVYEGEWKDGVAHGSGSVLRANGRKFDGIWYEGKLCLRAQSRPGTPDGFLGERRDRIEECETPGSLQDYNFDALVWKSAQDLGTVLPYMHKSGPGTVRDYEGDRLMNDEDTDVLHRCFWDKNKDVLARLPNYRIVCDRVEVPIVHKGDQKKKRFRHKNATKKEAVKKGFDPDALVAASAGADGNTSPKGFFSKVWSYMSPKRGSGFLGSRGSFGGNRSPGSPASPSSPDGSEKLILR